MYILENGQWKGDNTLDRSLHKFIHKKIDKINIFCKNDRKKYFCDLCIIYASYLLIMLSK